MSLCDGLINLMYICVCYIGWTGPPVDDPGLSFTELLFLYIINSINDHKDSFQHYCKYQLLGFHFYS